MSIIDDILRRGAKAALSSVSSESTGMDRIEECCASIGWEFDERVGPTAALMNFKNPLGPSRTLMIVCDNSGQLASLTVFSMAKFTMKSLPVDLGYYFLLRNSVADFPAWRVSETDGVIGFSATYRVLVAGIDYQVFKAICEQLVREANEADLFLRNKGHI